MCFLRTQCIHFLSREIKGHICNIKACVDCGSQETAVGCSTTIRGRSMIMFTRRGRYLGGQYGISGYGVFKTGIQN